MNALSHTESTPRSKPDIRAITRLVPPAGNLVQGQSELAISPALAEAAARIIASSQNHYGASEGVPALRRAIAAKIVARNNVNVDPDATPFELLITNGGTGALIAIAKHYLARGSILLFEPYYPYHRRITEELGGAAEIFPLLHDLTFDAAAVRRKCETLKKRASFPLRAIMVCTPSNPTGKVYTRTELEQIAQICQDLDLLCIADEVYEHYVVGAEPHISIASLPGMFERTITVNSFSKSWNISGWRLGYCYGNAKLVAPLNQVNNVFYVCPATPLQLALGEVLPKDPGLYSRLNMMFKSKRQRVGNALEQLGFQLYDSGSAFYIWARIPRPHTDAQTFNQHLLDRGVAAVPGAAFSDTADWDSYMRLCIAREDSVLDSAMERLRNALA